MPDRSKLPAWAKTFTDQKLDQLLAREQYFMTLTPQCPNCSSTNTRLTVINVEPTQWHCRACLHDWAWEPDGT